MDIEHETGGYKRGHIRHSTPGGDDLEREVRWFPSSEHTYRKSETAGRWVFVGRASSMDYAARLAALDMRVPQGPR